VDARKRKGSGMTNVRDLALMSNEALWSYFREQQAGLVAAAKSLYVANAQLLIENARLRAQVGRLLKTLNDLQGTEHGSSLVHRYDLGDV